MLPKVYEITNGNTPGAAHMTDTAPQRKALTLSLKAEGEPGAFVAMFSTLDVIDAHGDVTLAGAFVEGAEVLIGGYNHNTDTLPVGKGTIRVEGSNVYIDGMFNLNSAIGRETYEAVKMAGALMEWSYLYRALKWSMGEFEGQSVRFLEGLEVWSVDPVLKGAGEGTHTAQIKSGMRFTDHIEGARIALSDAVTRATSLIDVRTGKGKALSEDAREAITGLLISLDEGKAALTTAMAAPTESNEQTDVQAEVLRFAIHNARAHHLAA